MADFHALRDELLGGSDEYDTAVNMRRYMVPILGLSFTVVFLLVAIIFALRPGWSSFLRWVNIALSVVTLFVLVFFWFNMQWPSTFILTVITIFGIYAHLTFHRDHLKLWTIAGGLVLLALTGNLSIITGGGGYQASMLEQVFPGASQSTCATYYDAQDKAICQGYSNYLQFMSFVLTILEALMTFFGYVLYKNIDAENGSEQTPVISRAAPRYENISAKAPYQAQPSYDASYPPSADSEQ